MSNADDSTQIEYDTFRDFYSEISLTIANDKKFVQFVRDSWTLDTSSYVVSDKDVEQLVSAIRLNLLKFGNSRFTEEYVLRDLYREFSNNNGNLDLPMLVKILSKINLRAH